MSGFASFRNFHLCFFWSFVVCCPNLVTRTFVESRRKESECRALDQGSLVQDAGYYILNLGCGSWIQHPGEPRIQHHVSWNFDLLGDFIYSIGFCLNIVTRIFVPGSWRKESESRTLDQASSIHDEGYCILDLASWVLGCGSWIQDPVSRTPDSGVSWNCDLICMI